MPTEILHLLGVNAALSISLFLGLWLINLVIRDPSFIDGWWGLGLAVIAATSFLATGGAGAHRVALTLICTAWGLRLGLYLLWRWRGHGPDRRYSSMMAHAQEERGWSYAKASLLLVFALQAPLQFVVSLPVQLGQIADPGPLGAVAWSGVALAAAGLFFESVGDWQLARFKKDPANRGKVLQTGLWRYTRHPNYFGDACVWWGLWLVAAETTLGLFSIVGPAYLVFTLTRWSGVPTVEGRMRRRKPGYEDYMRRTSGFFPWPPKPPEAA